MADITVTAAKVGLVETEPAKTRNYIAAVAITKGQAVYQNTSGKAALADASAGGTAQFRGVALNGAAAGDAVTVAEDATLEGFAVSGLNGDAIVYLSNTAGALATDAGTTSVACGRVVAMTDGPTLTKVLKIFTRWSADWS